MLPPAELCHKNYNYLKQKLQGPRLDSHSSTEVVDCDCPHIHKRSRGTESQEHLPANTLNKYFLKPKEWSIEIWTFLNDESVMEIDKWENEKLKK